MRIRKRNKRAGTGEREFQYKICVNRPTHSWRDDKKNTKCKGMVSRNPMQEERNNLEPDTHDKDDGLNLDHGT
jgi:hypothetical protein